MILTRLFVGRTREQVIASLAHDGFPGEAEHAIDVEGLRYEALAALIDIVVDVGYHRAFTELANGSLGAEAAPLAHQLPAALTSRLASASAADLERWGIEWADCGESDAWDDDPVIDLLPRIADIARRARAVGGELYLWMLL
jgi:hypothetical protein